MRGLCHCVMGDMLCWGVRGAISGRDGGYMSESDGCLQEAMIFFSTFPKTDLFPHICSDRIVSVKELYCKLPF